MNESVRLTVGDHGIADLSWRPGTDAENDDRFGLSVATIGELAALMDGH